MTSGISLFVHRLNTCSVACTQLSANPPPSNYSSHNALQDIEEFPWIQSDSVFSGQAGKQLVLNLVFGCILVKWRWQHEYWWKTTSLVIASQKFLRWELYDWTRSLYPFLLLSYNDLKIRSIRGLLNWVKNSFIWSSLCVDIVIISGVISLFLHQSEKKVVPCRWRNFLQLWNSLT